MKNLGKIKEP
jgi:hypothetical protein